MAEGKTIQKRSDASRETEKQGLLLLHLVAAPGGAARQKELTDRRIACGPEVRGPLERQGLITTRRQGRGNVIEATDTAWDEAGKRLTEFLPEDAEGAGAVLRAWLGRIAAYLARQGMTPSHLLGTPDVADGTGSPAAPVTAPSAGLVADPAPPIPPEAATERKSLPPDAPAELFPRIREAYLAVTGGLLNVRALLKDLRPHLGDVPRATLDAALIAMQREGLAVLFRQDNGAALTPADRAAALTIVGEPRHILWISK